MNCIQYRIVCSFECRLSAPNRERKLRGTATCFCFVIYCIFYNMHKKPDLSWTLAIKQRTIFCRLRLKLLDSCRHSNASFLPEETPSEQSIYSNAAALAPLTTLSTLRNTVNLGASLQFPPSAAATALETTLTGTTASARGTVTATAAEDVRVQRRGTQMVQQDLQRRLEELRNAQLELSQERDLWNSSRSKETAALDERRTEIDEKQVLQTPPSFPVN